ncbi:uncharacterized protein V1516DRAFT_673037 [Lipomyces oligophaga]|uniref:uncharacterized protein n=1 Tax=Lipomyces oligophaga TaxID=45792 RepID=UPI0034CD6807
MERSTNVSRTSMVRPPSAAAKTPSRALSPSPSRLKSNSRISHYPPRPSSASSNAASPRPGSAASGYHEIDIVVGDLVYVPGGARGVVLYIGSVHGKLGDFAGVDLLGEDASKGKNDGTVNGVRYFNPSHERSGIFVPVRKVTLEAPDPVIVPAVPPLPSTPRPRSVLSSRTAGAGATPIRPPSSLAFERTMSPVPAQTNGNRRTTLGHVPVPSSGRTSRSSLSRPVAMSPSQSAPSSSNNGILTPRSRLPSTPNATGRRKSLAPSLPAVPSALKKGSQSLSAASLNDSNFASTTKSDSYEMEDSIDDGLHSVSISSSAEVTALKSELKSTLILLAERESKIKQQNETLQDMQATVAEFASLYPTPGSGSLPANSSDHNSNAAPAETRTKESSSEDAPLTKRELEMREMLQNKDSELAQLKQDLELKRQEFKDTMNTLQRASEAANQMYELQIEDLHSRVREGSMANSNDALEGLHDLEERLIELEIALETSHARENELEMSLADTRLALQARDNELSEDSGALKQSQSTLDQLAARELEIERKNCEIEDLKHQLGETQELITASNSTVITSQEFSVSIEAKEAEIFQLRAQLTDALAKASESVSNINNSDSERVKLEAEISNLEKMVEIRVFREQELERDLIALRDELSTAKDELETQRSLIEKLQSQRQPMLPLQKLQSNPPKSPLKPTSITSLNGSTLSTQPVLICDICGLEGHDIIDCKLGGFGSLGPDATHPVSSANPPPAPKRLWCALCERDGHSSIDCPDGL